MTGNSRWSRHSFKNEARWTQLVNAFWKKSAYACLFDTLFRTLGRLEPKWIVMIYPICQKSRPPLNVSDILYVIYIFIHIYPQKVIGNRRDDEFLFKVLVWRAVSSPSGWGKTLWFQSPISTKGALHAWVAGGRGWVLGKGKFTEGPVVLSMFMYFFRLGWNHHLEKSMITSNVRSKGMSTYRKKICARMYVYLFTYTYVRKSLTVERIT